MIPMEKHAGEEADRGVPEVRFMGEKDKVLRYKLITEVLLNDVEDGDIDKYYTVGDDRPVLTFLLLVGIDAGKEGDVPLDDIDNAVTAVGRPCQDEREKHKGENNEKDVEKEKIEVFTE